MQTYEIITTIQVEVDDDVTEADVYRALNGSRRERWITDHAIDINDHVQEFDW